MYARTWATALTGNDTVHAFAVGEKVYGRHGTKIATLAPETEGGAVVVAEVTLALGAQAMRLAQRDARATETLLRGHSSAAMGRQGRDGW